MTDNSPNVNISHHFQSQISNANADVVSDCFTWVQLFVLCIRISIFPVYLWSSSCLSFVPPFLTWLSGEAASQGSRVAFLHGDTLHGDGDLRRHLLPLRFRLRTQGVRTLSRRQLWGHRAVITCHAAFLTIVYKIKCTNSLSQHIDS